MKNKEFDFSKMICFLLNSTSNAMIREYRPHLEEFQLTYPQYLVMMTLWNNDNILIKDISKETFFDSATLTPILKRLEEKSYIIRTQSLSDERGKIIKLTKEGKDLKDKTAHIFKSMECKIELSSEEQEDIIKICNKILSKLSN